MNPEQNPPRSLEERLRDLLKACFDLGAHCRRERIGVSFGGIPGAVACRLAGAFLAGLFGFPRVRATQLELPPGVLVEYTVQWECV